MKQKTFIIEEYEEEQKTYVQESLLKMTEEGNTHLQLRLKYYQKPLTAKKLDCMADLIKEIGKKQEFTIDIVLETNQWARVKRLYKKLNQYSLRLELAVSDRVTTKAVARYAKKTQLEKLLITCEDYVSFQKAYQKWKTVGLTIEAVEYTFSVQEYQDFFDKWVHDAEAVWLTPFEDILYSMLTGISSGSCEHSSCMGKYLYLDAEGNVYFCARKKAAAKMYHIREQHQEALYNETYQIALQRAIEKRTQCMEQCTLFGMCRGGCPLTKPEPSFCAEYVQKLQHTERFLEKEIQNGFINMENPCLRKLYLTMIAYGFRQENS